VGAARHARSRGGRRRSRLPRLLRGKSRGQYAVPDRRVPAAGASGASGAFDVRGVPLARIARRKMPEANCRAVGRGARAHRRSRGGRNRIQKSGIAVNVVAKGGSKPSGVTTALARYGARQCLLDAGH